MGDWMLTPAPYCTSLGCVLPPCVYEGMQQIVLTAGRKGRAQVQSVLLLTDGLANEGIKSKDGILGEMRKLQDSKKVREVGREEEGEQYITSNYGAVTPATLDVNHRLAHFSRTCTLES